MLVDRLGVDPEQVKFIQGDTDAVAFGMGTGGSRSTTMSGGAIVMVSEKIVAKGKKLAAHLLEAAEDDVEFKDGRFIIAGTDRGLSIHEVAKSAFLLEKLPPGMEPGLYETATYRARSGNFPNGCHVCEVEIDPETGATRVVGYWVVDDVGTVINPLLVKGQIMGGIAQGMGQVLMEDKAYDIEGQVLTGSFTDYAMPRADELPQRGDRGQSGADADQPARRQGSGRGRHRRLAVGRGQRDRGRALGARRQAHRHALHAVQGVAGDPGGRSEIGLIPARSSAAGPEVGASDADKAHFRRATSAAACSADRALSGQLPLLEGAPAKMPLTEDGVIPLGGAS